MKAKIENDVVKFSAPNHLPSKLNIDENDLPELKDWKVGEVYTFTVKAKLQSLRKNDPSLMAQGDEDADKMHADFVIEEVKSDEEQEKHEKQESEKQEKIENSGENIKKAVSKLKDYHD